jgi:hypothetical protein
MKRKIMALLALILILAMESITVFATEEGSPSVDSGAFLYGSVGDNTLIQLTTIDGTTTEYSYADIGMINANDAVITGLTEADKTLIRFKAQELTEYAKQKGYNSVDSIGFDLTSSSTNQTMNFLDSRVKATDKENGLVEVYHLLPNGTWEAPYFVSFDGGVSVTFTQGFSPVIIVKYSNVGSGDAYGTKTQGTITGQVSPKTSDTGSYAIFTTIISLACILACTRKLVKR